MKHETEKKVQAIEVLSTILSEYDERLRQDKAIGSSELRYRRLFETARDGILILDAETGMIVDVNPYLINMLGYSKDTFVKKTIWEIGLFKDIVENRENFLELQQKGYMRYEDMPLRTFDGHQVDVEFVSNVYIVENIRVIQCNIRDITDRKKADRAVNASELRYRRLFETARDGILILDAETGMIMDVNPFLIDMLGYTKNTFIKKTIWEIGLFKDIIANKENFLELQEKGYMRYEDMPLQTFDGRQIDVEFVSNVYSVEDYKVIQCNIRDITDSVQSKALLKDKEERYNTLSQSSIDGFYVMNTQWEIIEVNEALCRMTGYSMCVLNTMTKTDLVSEELIEGLKERMAMVIDKGYDHYESKYKRADGSIIDVQNSITYIPNKKLFLCFVNDISDRKKSEKEIIYISFHDQLTGLYNRRFYEEELKRLDIVRNLPLSMVMGDVNGLKLVNDSFGHVMGDDLLKKIADVLKKVCRSDEIIARLGGDEFIILLPRTTTQEAEDLIQRIQEQISSEKIGPFDINISFGYNKKKNIEEDIHEIFKRTEDHMYRNKLSESSSIRNKTVNLILSTLFEKNNREMLHSKRVSEICVAIATKMKLSVDNINQIRTVGLMHDIGKIGIDERILNEAEKLNPDERKDVERHSEIGYQILSSVNDFSEIAKFVLEHHERYDGSGYPKGLKGDQISMQAKIIAIADAYDAMTSGRTYKVKLSENDALKEIKRCAGTHFDPKITHIFVEKVLRKAW